MILKNTFLKMHVALCESWNKENKPNFLVVKWLEGMRVSGVKLERRRDVDVLTIL